MYVYTTPCHTFRNLPVPIESIKSLYITYAQRDKVLFEYTLDDCMISDDNSITLQLSQEDTSKINPEILQKLEVQLTLLTIDNRRYTSDIKYIKLDRALKKEVI